MPAEFQQPDDRALWRFGIISPLLHATDDSPPVHERIAALALGVFYTPAGVEKRFSPDTIRAWLSRYRCNGIEGLRDKPHKNRGSTSVPEALQTALAEARKAQPCWTLKRLLSALRSQGLWNGRTPGRSALYRFAATHGLSRKAPRAVTAVRSFEFPFFGDLWSADFLHGPKVRRGVHMSKTYLHAVIDDATRYIVVARFHLAEGTRSMLDDLMLAIRRFGIPKRLYTDNGCAYRSKHLKLVAARLGISLPHTPAYTPRGRGKIERFFRSVRDGFLTGRATTSLDKLNADFAVWLNQYHHTQHRGLAMSPLSRKLTDAGPALKQLAPTQDIDDIFRMEHNARVGSDGCIRLFNTRFEVPAAMPGSHITVYYLPWNQDSVFIGPDKLRLKPLDAKRNALRFDKPRRGDSARKETDQ